MRFISILYSCLLLFFTLEVESQQENSDLFPVSGVYPSFGQLMIATGWDNISAILMYGFDKKSMHLYHDSDEEVTFTIQIDILGDEEFKNYKSISMRPDEYVHYEFPDAYQAHWIRVTIDKNCKAPSLIMYN